MSNRLFKVIMACFLGGIMLSACQPTQNTEQDFTVIPKPNQITPGKGLFKLKESTHFTTNSKDEEIKYIVAEWNRWIEKSTGFKHQITDEKSGSYIDLILDENYQAEISGAYTLDIQRKHIQITSNSNIGLYYGMQSLRQLLPAELESKTAVTADWTIPVGKIVDQPRFSYRGLHLDVGRHFFPVSFVKKFIDLLALHKMNIFHWHLTEDQGWRIEIKKYPRLTEVGSVRKETIVGHGGRSNKFDGKEYGGFYTQEEAKEIVKYAQERFITVIPEIELPGHSLGALAAYPHLGCTGGPYEVATRWGVFNEVYCAGNEEVFKFLEDVLTEVIAIFPSKYIHIGGDECPKGAWKKCPKCQKRIKEEGLKDEHELQSYFITRMEKFLVSKGRNIIGWDEILEGGLAPNATVMSWRGEKGGIEAAKQHHNVIMTPGNWCYLDHYQGSPDEEPLAIGGFTTTEESYSYNPTPEALTDAEKKYILGVQGNLWSEYFPDSKHVEYMAYPRASALAEVGWTNLENKSWDDFALRLKKHFKRFELLDVNFFNKVLMPSPSVKKIEFLTSSTLTLKNNAIGADLYYTVDGSEPTTTSTKYTEPIAISKEGVIKAVAINEDGKKSKVLEVKAVKLKFQEGKGKKGASAGLQCKLAKGKFGKCADVLAAKGKTIKVNSIAIPKAAPADLFGLVFEGMISIEKEGLYKFSIGSDDGSQLFFNGSMLINNDGGHAMKFEHANVALRPGVYPIKVVYFEGTGGENLKLNMTAPEGKEQQIPTEMLSY
ncbi:beta-N-acetylhexosaminidase [Puteibacter caeruleilacunae]|nr:beta-N-acetylhexosaminidase [Puteibacter caeruleilacunae]